MPATEKEVQEWSIDNLVRSYREVSGQVAINQTTPSKHPNADENLRVLDAEIRRRLHAGANAERYNQKMCTGQ